jgi:hypothetical protein
MTDMSSIDHSRPATAVEVRSQVNLIQEVMKAVMRDGTHFGKVPGTDKPTLFKAGAEKVLSTFRIAATVRLVDDLSTNDSVRYRVTVQGVNQGTGVVLGDGIGECSSDEEKYKWRRPVHPNEYDATPEDQRREKWARDGTTWKQVRVHPADVANTVLKMAHKRALVAMTLVVTAASDIFTQDIEDLPEEVRESVTAEDVPSKPASQPPQRKSAPTPAPTNSHGCTITLVEAFKGTSRNGKPYEKFTINLSDGRKGSTFDVAIRDLAVALRADGAQVNATIESKGGYPTITELWAVQPETAGSDDDQPVS